MTTVSNLPTPPSRGDEPDAFVDAADAFLGALPDFVTETNALASELNALAGAVSSGTAIAIALTFRSSTTDSDPGADGNGSFRLNHATPASATTIYIDDKDNASADILGLLDSICGSTSTIKGYLRLYKNSSNYLIYSCTAITTATGYRKLTVTYQSGTGSLSAADTVTMYFTRTGDAATFNGDLNNGDVLGIRQAAFDAEVSCTTSAIDWTTGHLQKLAEPTGAVTWGSGWTSPGASNPCHLQLRILSDGTSTAQTFTWPAAVKWLGSQWTAANNKNAVINFFWDGSTYWAQGVNEA